MADVYPLDKRALAIGKLLVSRGGIGPKVLDNWAKFDEVGGPSKRTQSKNARETSSHRLNRARKQATHNAQDKVEILLQL